MITNRASGTNIHEIAADIYRINTPVAIPGTAGFSFNQYLVVDDEPFLFHTGLRRLFPVVSEAITAVVPVPRLKYVALSHFEADECGAINEFLAVAPNAVPVCGRVAAMTSVNDFADRLPKVLADNAWECGLAMDMTTRTFFCGDLFTQGGDGAVALTESDILGPSEAFRKPLDYFAHAPQTREVLDVLARHEPMTMAVMHGSAWRGNGAQLLRALRDALSA
jgi:hypothetical protein